MIGSYAEDDLVGPFKLVFPLEFAIAAEEDPLVSCPENEGPVVGFLVAERPPLAFW